MFEEILDSLAAMDDTIEHYIYNLDDIVRDYEYLFLDDALEELVEAARVAMAQMREYSVPQAEPLVEHLIDNLQQRRQNGDPVHVWIVGHQIFVFDEEEAGTHSDLVNGLYHGTGAPGQKAAYWKYGIYKPSVEGHVLKPSAKRRKDGVLIPQKAISDGAPSYSDVISQRLANWGEKAPYWYFIEYGNQGTGREYPSTAGRPFINMTRARVQQEFDQFMQEVIVLLGERIGGDLEYFWSNPKGSPGRLYQQQMVRLPSGAVRFTSGTRNVR